MILMGRIQSKLTVASVVCLMATPGWSADLVVVATTKPVHSLVAQVMGDSGAPGLVVKGNTSPHTFALKPSDVSAFTRADLVFRMSEAVEPFTRKLLSQIPKSATLVTLAAAPGVRQLPQRAGGPFEAQGHAGHDHDHGHDKNTKDGHVWLDPTNAALMLDAIAAALAAKVPARADAFRANAATAKARLTELAAELKTALAPAAGKPFVLFHDATQYFERAFGLSAAGAITTDPDVPPSGKRLSALRAKLVNTSAACVFSEPTFDAKVVGSVAEGTSARTGVLDPEGTEIAAGADHYAQTLRGLAKSFRECLVS